MFGEHEQCWDQTLRNLCREMSLLDPVSSHFFLTGSAALAVFWLGHRKVDNLDFFTTEDVDFHAFGMYLKNKYGKGVLAANDQYISEITALTGEDVIVLQGRLFLKVEKGKGNKKRTVPVQDEDVARKLIAIKDRKGTLFGVKPSTLQVYAFYTSRATNVDFRTHRLRHTAATRMLAQGTPIDVVQVILGHSNINMTRRYACTLPETETLFNMAVKIDC